MPVGNSGFSVPPGRLRTLPSIRTTHSERSFSAVLEGRAVGIGHHLREAVMVAQVDEQHAAMIADAVAPAREAHGLADMLLAERAACMAAVAVHGYNARISVICG